MHRLPRLRDGLPKAGEFSLPLGLTIPVLACLFVAWLLWQMTASEAIGLVALLAAASLFYGLRALLRRAGQ